ncbi:DNA polymerase III subunit chi [uncultured Paracoccus sp.]|uniref:DNA polymerase III subunit chi n=1 Tax=uncultured Paracoccus sp. TaxID=189685 RepID=UPI0025F2FE2A|nr:DNA polymerase III subunit chi [uncultured Paracoccus sp.]
MGAALFYHLTRSAPEALLPVLIGKSLDAGWRVELRGRSAGTLAALDQRLWQGEGFLPHGLAGGPHDARQPVLLTLPDQPATNLPACLIAIEGVAVAAQDCTALERVCILFDGNDDAALDVARQQWRDLTGQGVEAQYWSEASGRWQRRQ